MSQIPHDKADQLHKVQQLLLPGEQVLAVYDGKGVGTGFIGLTDRRVILQDNSFVGGKSAVTSLPYSRISAVSFVADKSIFGKLAASSTVAIAVGNVGHEVEFRGDEKARHAHDVILHYVLQR
ncbi:PH domain-containing protein [Lapillicoccus jejuensis]|uniref:PH (Pleckstrin Homology) domain-containing protein n=1 Tax=Lapillicoccus jejuensis TaxID=402171 RepID=A0A542DV82_9MICO|nr:PH domain-containing protein [Lapillicoccus jejuensis]TQJ06978.1 PH (Pleckstrin Homology) domain-containing protein [Lapillicoccus jejuensis]